MRALFLLLLFGNLGFLAYSQYGAGLYTSESGLLSQQINPQAIQLLDAEQMAKAAASPREVARTVACLEWGAFVAGDLPRVEGALASLGLGGRIARRFEEAANYWVFMPPQESRQAAAVKTGELKRLGVDDFFVVLEDPKYRFAISLGVFRTEAAAQKRLEQLRARGVRTARVGPRDTPAQRTWFQLRDVPEAAAAKLEGLRADIAGSELRECAAENR